MKDEFINHLYLQHQKSAGIPDTKKAKQFFENLIALLFPQRGDGLKKSKENIEEQVGFLKGELCQMLKIVSLGDEESKCKCDDFFNVLPKIYDSLQKDAQALTSGDPAAVSLNEVIACYPGFYAVATYRIAHQLFLQKIPLLPRILSENAHTLTGIDIHPGASIGEYFCIDHGTGLVVGETATIGNHVKIYQNVTLGALSVKKEFASMKRHPTIEDGVVIYAGATILGGNTVIGKNSIIGGNVWITESIAADSKVYHEAKLVMKS